MGEQPDTESGNPVPKNKDGLILPNTSLFLWWVRVYKAILALNSLGLIAILIWLPWSFAHIDATLSRGATIEEKMENHLLQGQQPVAAIDLVVYGIHNIIGWLGIVTLRQRYLKTDFGFLCVFLLLGIVKVILLLVDNDEVLESIGEAIWYLIVIGILFTIIRQIQRENSETTADPEVDKTDQE